MVRKARIVLNEEKEIQGNKYKPGTTMAEINTAGDFLVEHVDLAFQMGQVRIVPEEIEKKSDKKNTK